MSLIQGVYLFQILLVIFSIFPATSGISSPKLQELLPCPLKWSQYTAGNAILTTNLLSIDSNPFCTISSTSAVDPTDFIARKKLFGDYNLGSIDVNFVAHFISKIQSPMKFLSYELLDNPHKCCYEWIPGTNKSMTPYHTVLDISAREVDKSSTIGRTFIASTKIWVPCTTVDKHDTCFFNNVNKKDRKLEATKNFQRLIAYHPGLSINDFRNLSVTVTKDSYTLHIAGNEVVRNKADVDIRKSIVHTTTTTTTLNWNFGFSFRIQLGLSLNIMKNWIEPLHPDLAIYLAFSQDRDWYQGRVEETVESISKNLDIPGRTCVEIMSALVMRKITLNVVGIAEITASGLNGREIEKVLRNNDFKGSYTLENDAVLVSNVNATFEGNVPIRTEFAVLPCNRFGNILVAEKMWKNVTNQKNQPEFSYDELMHFIEFHAK